LGGLPAAERHGWRIVAEFVDNGISGAKGRDQRPAFDRLCRAIVRHEFDIVAAWSVDRLAAVNSRRCISTVCSSALTRR
jgi:DNA invertase Pin-like site-specific DNA recombinase